MVEVKNGIFSAVANHPSPDAEVTDRFEKFAERRHEDKDRSADIEQLTATISESLPLMPVLTLRPQAVRPGRALHMERKTGACRFDQEAQKPDLLRDSLMRTGPMPGALVKRNGKEGKANTLPLALENRIHMPQAELDALASVAGAASTALTQSPRNSRKRQEDMASDGAIRMSFPGPQFGERQPATVSHQPALFKAHDKLQEAQDRSGAKPDMPADGWNFNFRSWGAQHSVKIASLAGKPDAEAQLSLLPSSSLVEQRLQSHVKDQGGWILHEHRDDQQQDRSRQHRDDAEEDER